MELKKGCQGVEDSMGSSKYSHFALEPMNPIESLNPYIVVYEKRRQPAGL